MPVDDSLNSFISFDNTSSRFSIPEISIGGEEFSLDFFTSSRRFWITEQERVLSRRVSSLTVLGWLAGLANGTVKHQGQSQTFERVLICASLRELAPLRLLHELCQLCLQLLMEQISTQSFPAEDLPQGHWSFFCFLFLLPESLSGLDRLSRLGEGVPAREEGESSGFRSRGPGMFRGEARNPLEDVVDL